MELLSFSSISFRLGSFIEGFILKCAHEWIRDFDGVLHDEMVNSFSTRGFTQRSLIEIEWFAKVFSQTISHDFIKIESFKRNSFLGVFFPGRKICLFEKRR